MSGLKNLVLGSAGFLAGPLSLLPSSFRYGRGYADAAREIDAHSALSEDQQRQTTFRKLRDMVVFATEQVPFYRSFYRDRDFDPSALLDVDDWDKVPIVTKSDFKKAALESRSSPGARTPLGNTGGTSGEPLSFLLPENAAGIEWAHMHRLWVPFGYKASHLKLRLGGTYLLSDEPYMYHPRHNELIVNANAALPDVVERLLRRSPRNPVRWVHGYPSLVAEFARTLAAADTSSIDRFRDGLLGVLLGSEYPAPMYRSPIERFLSPHILSWYGHSEMAVLAGETAQGEYRSIGTYGFAEAVASEDDASHRLVCTSLYNFAHPFIRYDTGDMIEPLGQQGSALAFRIAEGRIGEFVLDEEGRALALTSIIFGRHHRAFDDVAHVQVRQRTPGRITLLIVPRDPNADMAEIAKGFDFAGLRLRWDIERVHSPTRSALGKVRLKVDG